MGELEVLIRELLAVDGLSTGALHDVSVAKRLMLRLEYTDVTTGEVTALKHEVGDHTVELGPLISEALLFGAQSTEILGSLGNDIVEKLEVDAAGAL